MGLSPNIHQDVYVCSMICKRRMTVPLHWPLPIISSWTIAFHFFPIFISIWNFLYLSISMSVSASVHMSRALLIIFNAVTYSKSSTFYFLFCLCVCLFHNWLIFLQLNHRVFNCTTIRNWSRTNRITFLYYIGIEHVCTHTQSNARLVQCKKRSFKSMNQKFKRLYWRHHFKSMCTLRIVNDSIMALWDF